MRRKKTGLTTAGRACTFDEAAHDADLAARREKKRAAHPSTGNARLSRDASRRMFRDLRRTLDKIKELEASPEARLEELTSKRTEDLTPEEIDEFRVVSERLYRKREPCESCVAWRQRRRKEVRVRLLDRFLPHRKCPVCERTRVKSRSWVLVTRAMLRALYVQVASGDVLLTDVAKLKKTPLCCLSCWRERFTHAPRDVPVSTSKDERKVKKEVSSGR